MGGGIVLSETSVARLRSGSKLNLVGAAINTVCTLGVALATTRALDPGGAGVVFALTSAFLMAATILRLGTPTALVLFIAREKDTGGLRSRAFVRVAVRKILPLALGGTAIGLLAAVILPRIAPDSVFSHSPPLLAALAVILPFAVLLDTLLAVSRGQHDMTATVLIERIGRPAAQLVLSLAAWLWWPTVLGVGLAWALPYIPALAASTRTIAGLRTGPAAPVARGERREFRSFLWSRSMVSISQILFARLDVLLLAVLTSPREAAIYTAATRFVVVAQLVQSSIGTALEPGLARTVADADTRGLRKLYTTGTSWSVALAWPMLLLAAITAPWWLRVFGKEYTAGVSTVLVLTAAMMLSTGLGTVESLLNMAGRARSLVFYNLGGLALMIGLDVLLIPRYGAFGAAIGWAATIAFKNVVPAVETYRQLGVHPFSTSWLSSALVALVGAAGFPLLGESIGRLPGLIAGIAIGAALWLVAIRWLRRENARPPGRHSRSMDVHTPA